MPDQLYEHPRLAAIYDALDPDRSDLLPYLSTVREFNARTVADLGCGTGVLALQLARLGLGVTAVDPAGGSLEVARNKTGADAVVCLRNQGSGPSRLGNVDQEFHPADQQTGQSWGSRELGRGHSGLPAPGQLSLDLDLQKRRPAPDIRFHPPVPE